MAEKRIYAGYYKRYDGTVIYVVTTAEDADTGEETVIWTPSLYADTRQYFTMSKKSFCGYVEVGGKHQAKFKRQTSMRLSDAAAERYEEEGFRGPVRKRYSVPMDGYDAWEQPRAQTYYEYAKALCEVYRLGLRKYQLCVSEKKYIGISKKDFLPRFRRGLFRCLPPGTQDPQLSETIASLGLVAGYRSHYRLKYP